MDPSSAVKYETSYRPHVEPTYGRRQVKSIRPSEVGEWLTELGNRYGFSTARTALLVLQGTLELAVEDGSIRKNPARSRVVHRPSAARPNIQAWPDETVDQISDGHPPLFRPLPIIGAACGLRQGEIFGLAAEDIDYDDEVIHVRRQVKKRGARVRSPEERPRARRTDARVGRADAAPVHRRPHTRGVLAAVGKAGRAGGDRQAAVPVDR